MKNKKLKLSIRFEFAIEVIIFCVIFILFGLAFLFASNLLSFNWISVVFVLLGVTLIYLKASSSIELVENKVMIQYLKFFHKKTIKIEEVDKVIFYEDSHLVEIQTKEQKTVQFYLKQKNREILLNFVVTNCPNTPCLFYDRTDETAR